MRAAMVFCCCFLACAGPPLPGPADAGAAAADAGDSEDAGLPDAGSFDGGSGDAGVPDAGPLTLTVYPRLGSPVDDARAPHGPGLVLMGGGSDVDQAFVWAQAVLAGDGGAAGDVVVLRASGADGYTAYLRDLAPFNSVQTLKLTPPASGADLAFAAEVVSRAEFVFFAGGDQSMYAAWQGSPLLRAVQGVYARGGVVGGTSAGLAILGEHVFDAVAANGASISTSLAVADPASASLSFSRALFAFPALSGVLTDSHFRARDCMGRLVAFGSRLHADGAVPVGTKVLGLGLDEGTALLVDASGFARLALQTPGAGGAWAVRIGPPATWVVGQPLQSSPALVTRLSDPSTHTFDFNTGCGTGPRFLLTVDGTRSPNSSPADPYGAADESLACP